MCAVIFGALVKRSNREYALIISVAACVVIFFVILDSFEPVIAQITHMTDYGGVSGEILPVILKAVGIATVGQLAENVCKDAGESAMAYVVSLAAKAAVIAVALPLFAKVFEYLEEIVKL